MHFVLESVKESERGVYVANSVKKQKKRKEKKKKEGKGD